MTMKLFVGGLSWDTTSDGLKESFASFGKLEDVKLIKDFETGRSRGFGFITFSQEDDAVNAMAEMDGKELDGRTIRVNEARSKKPRRDDGYGDNNRGYNRRY